MSVLSQSLTSLLFTVIVPLDKLYEVSLKLKVLTDQSSNCTLMFELTMELPFKRLIPSILVDNVVPFV